MFSGIQHERLFNSYLSMDPSSPSIADIIYVFFHIPSSSRLFARCHLVQFGSSNAKAAEAESRLPCTFRMRLQQTSTRMRTRKKVFAAPVSRSLDRRYMDSPTISSTTATLHLLSHQSRQPRRWDRSTSRYIVDPSRYHTP